MPNSLLAHLAQRSLTSIYLEELGRTDGRHHQVLLYPPSFVAGFFDRREFILAQHPLESTCASFWQMVWEQNVHLLVMLSAIDGQECGAFWPSGGHTAAFFEVGFQKMKVTTLDEVETATWKAFRLSLEVRRSDEVF